MNFLKIQSVADGRKNKILLFLGLILFFSLASFIIIFLFTATKDFPVDNIIKIEEGSTVRDVSIILQEKNVIKSKTLFNLLIQFSERKTVQAGDYIFDKPLNIFEIVNVLSSGNYGIEIKKITFIEGITVKEIADKLLDSDFVNIDKERFIELALPYEGYLFPDTYYFKVSTTENEIIEKMMTNFNEKIELYQGEISDSKRTLDDIIKMASIVEKEATIDTFNEIANILWKRLDISMPLQVDATFVYSIGKHSFDVTLQEMRDPSNLYNTYENFGLPPTPISNPGLQSIIATIRQEETDYLFFLTGLDGNMYYAKDHDGHVRNKRLYLD